MAKATEEVKCEILEKCGVIGDRVKSKLELRYVAWNGKEPRYDIRPWYVDDKGIEKCNKGVTLSGEELLALGDIINKLKEDNA